MENLLAQDQGITKFHMTPVCWNIEMLEEWEISDRLLTELNSQSYAECNIHRSRIQGVVAKQVGIQ